MRKFILAALFILPVTILLPHLEEFPFQTGAVYSDLLITHYPNTLYLQRSLLEWRTIPLWSPAILSGYSFAANPLSGLHYLPGWLSLFFPLPLGINLIILLHLIWGGVGMYLFLRAEELSEGAALLGALTFEALPKLFSHLGAGHVTLIYAVIWTPWLLYAERQAWERPAHRLLPGLVLGIIVLADVRWAAYSGMLWVGYSIYYKVRFLRLPVNLIGYLLANILVAGFIAAPLLLPLAQYTQLSTRSQLTPQESFILSLPPGQLFGLVYPNIAGAAEWVLYPGAVNLALAVYVLSRPAARRKSAFWLVVIAATLIYALGSYLPALEWIARLPGMDLLRVPPRVLFLTGFCFAVVAAIGLENLYADLALHKPATRDRSGLMVFAVSAFTVLFAIAAWMVMDKTLPRIQFAWGAAFLLAGSAIILLARVHLLSASALTVLVLTAGLVDLIGVNGLSLDFRPEEAVFIVGRQAATYLDKRDPGALFRVYSPSYSLPQHLAARYRLELSDGIDPLQWSAYSQYMEPATGVPFSGYSVTLPPYANGDPTEDNARYTPDAEKLGLLNVKYIVSAFPIQANGLVLLARFGETRVYQNRFALPRAWVQPPDVPPGREIFNETQPDERPNQILLRASGPGLLVLSELAYPGWQANIDGKPAQVETVGGLLRGVRLSSGEHEVSFLFRPVLFYAGLALSALAWMFIIYFGWLRHRFFREERERDRRNG